MNKYFEIIKKSAGASILISLGCYVLLKIGNPFGPFLFSLGLLGVCYLNLNLFTGKCGFYIKDKIKKLDIFLMLFINLIVGYLCGLAYSYTDIDIFNSALEKVVTWDISVGFFIKSILCGIVMYTAVCIYKKGSNLGILLGVPLFIFAGFQHCIANVIYMGVARTFDLSIIVCIIGNFVGSILAYYFSKETIKE